MEIAYGFCIFFIVLFFVVAGILYSTLFSQSSFDNNVHSTEKKEKQTGVMHPVEVVAVQAKLKTLEARIPEMTPSQVKDVDFIISSL